MNRRSHLLFCLTVFLFTVCINTLLSAQVYEIGSPDGRVNVRIEVGGSILYSVYWDS